MYISIYACLGVETIMPIGSVLEVSDYGFEGFGVWELGFASQGLGSGV